VQNETPVASLNGVEDTFEAWAGLNPNRILKPELQILLSGLNMEDPAASEWWRENRGHLKQLKSWSEFATKVREQFIPANWEVDTLALFYATVQGSRDFQSFLADLQAARSALASAGSALFIADPIFKNHLLFFSHPILQLRVRSNPTLSFPNITVDMLIAFMSSTWDILVAEGAVNVSPFTASCHPDIIMPSHSSASPIPPSISTRPLVELTCVERQHLRVDDYHLPRLCCNQSAPEALRHDAEGAHTLPVDFPYSIHGCSSSTFSLAGYRVQDEISQLNTAGETQALYELGDAKGEIKSNLQHPNSRIQQLEDAVLQAGSRIYDLEGDLRKSQDMATSLEQRLNLKVDEVHSAKIQIQQLKNALRHADQARKDYVAELEEGADAAVEYIKGLLKDLASANDEIHRMAVTQAQTQTRVKKLEGRMKEASEKSGSSQVTFSQTQLLVRGVAEAGTPTLVVEEQAIYG